VQNDSLGWIAVLKPDLVTTPTLGKERQLSAQSFAGQVVILGVVIKVPRITGWYSRLGLRERLGLEHRTLLLNPNQLEVTSSLGLVAMERRRWQNAFIFSEEKV
jgi:hypothetical protein